MNQNKKTELRISKSGKRYYINPELYNARLEKKRKERLEENPNTRIFKPARATPYCHDKKNEAYMRYYGTKSSIRSEYPEWKSMDREQWLEYYTRVLNLIYTDTDFAQYKEETKTLQDIADDKWWNEKKQKEKEYDGSYDEYHN